MYAREGRKRPCAYCGTPTWFVRVETGSRGKAKSVDTCVPCGEDPARREPKAAA